MSDNALKAIQEASCALIVLSGLAIFALMLVSPLGC